MKSILERMLIKVTSARFVFVQVVAFVFAWMAIKGTLPVERVTEIILLVFYAYFSRSDRKPGREEDA